MQWYHWRQSLESCNLFNVTTFWNRFVSWVCEYKVVDLFLKSNTFVFFVFSGCFWPCHQYTFCFTGWHANTFSSFFIKPKRHREESHCYETKESSTGRVSFEIFFCKVWEIPDINRMLVTFLKKMIFSKFSNFYFCLCFFFLRV